MGLVGVGLSVALLTSACGPNAAAGNGENSGASSSASGASESSSASGSGSSSAAASAGQGDLPQGSEAVKLDPAEFTTRIDNPYWPMAPGSKWVYSETDTKGTHQKVVVEVTHKTKMIANGIEARVVRDTATENGKITEQTDDWYAQDKAGNIWYLGEVTAEYKNGKVTTRSGSFEAGVDGAQPGIALPANPEPGLSYRQEYYKGEAEDKGAVVTVGDEQVQVPFGFFDKDVLMTRDLVPTEPKAQELKFYAPNVGPVLSVHTDGDGGRAELVSYNRGG
ncbi:MAG: hypothetical protein ACR2HO_11700 [Rubrobacteraceae bacterium]